MKSRSGSEDVSHLGKQVSDATIFMHQAMARNAGLSGVDHKYLGIILDKGPLTAGDLASLTGLTTGAVTGLIDRLEKKKLVKRQFDKDDRRKILIVPNADKVNKLFTNFHVDLRERMDALLDSCTPAEIKAIQKYLTSAVAIMNDITRKLNAK